jgi:hypothetical protein
LYYAPQQPASVLRRELAAAGQIREFLPTARRAPAAIQLGTGTNSAESPERTTDDLQHEQCINQNTTNTSIRCFNCFKIGHFKSNCRSPPSCSYCVKTDHNICTGAQLSLVSSATPLVTLQKHATIKLTSRVAGKT